MIRQARIGNGFSPNTYRPEEPRKVYFIDILTLEMILENQLK
jgi:hypothetical protein